MLVVNGNDIGKVLPDIILEWIVAGTGIWTGMGPDPCRAFLPVCSLLPSTFGLFIIYCAKLDSLFYRTTRVVLPISLLFFTFSVRCWARWVQYIISMHAAYLSTVNAYLFDLFFKKLYRKINRTPGVMIDF